MPFILKELLTTYWNNSLIILGIIGFFVSRYFNLKSKKVETKYALFQSNKISTVIKFYAAFNKTVNAWIRFNIHKYLSNQITPREMQEIISSNIAELRISLFELTMYFDREEMDLFTLVYDEISKIHYFVYALPIPNNDRAKSANEFMTLRNEIIESSENMMKVIGIKLRSDYKND